MVGKQHKIHKNNKNNKKSGVGQLSNFINARHSSNTFTDTETNIALLIILAVILLLFWIPLAEIIR